MLKIDSTLFILQNVDELFVDDDQVMEDFQLFYPILLELIQRITAIQMNRDETIYQVVNL